MLKKMFVVLALLIVLPILTTDCCPEPQEISYQLNSFELNATRLTTELVEDSTIESRKFRLKLNLKVDGFVNNVSTKHFFNSPLYATSCMDSYNGLETDIVGFVITCNQKIFGIEANNPIDYSRIQAYKSRLYEYKDSENPRRNITEMLSELNKNASMIDFKWYLEFKEKIDSSNYLKFKIQIKLSNGKEFASETNSIKLI